ncbi:MAG: endonuclease MutS2, partial [Nannocystaceae bacterium]
MCRDAEEIVHLLGPLPSVDSARACFVLQDQLEAALERAGTSASQTLSTALREVEDLGPSLDHAAQGGVLDVLEMAGVMRTLEASRAVVQLLGFAPDGMAAALRAWARDVGAHREGVWAAGAPADGEDEEAGDLARLPNVTALEEALRRAISWTAEGPALRDDASEALRLARGRLSAAQRTLGVAAAALVKKLRTTQGLRDEFWTEREGRVVVPVRADGLHRLEDEGAIVHGSSGTGQTLFVEPTSLIAKNNAVKAAQRGVRAETRKVLESLTSQIRAAHGVLLDHQRFVASADELHARLRFAAQIDGVSPTLVSNAEGAAYRLAGARHPGMLLDGATVVPFDLDLEVGSALIVSGPNAGGKTVTLKTLGLCVLLAKSGLRVPCEAGAQIPWGGAVVTSVGDDQSIVASLSTFTAQLDRIKMALKLADRVCPPLVLLDEIAAGTEPEQGASLAEAVVRALVERGGTVLATTHYETLKVLGSQVGDSMYGKVAQASVGFDLQRMAPTFEFFVGAPGASSAIEVARRVGVDEVVLARAEAALDPERVRLDELVRALSSERSQLAAKLTALEEEEARLTQRTRALDGREARLDARAEREKLRAYDSAARELNAFEGEVRRRRKSLGRAGDTPQDREDQRALVARGEEVLERHRPPRVTPEGAPLQEVHVGDRVRVAPLDAEGEVVAIRGKRVEVQLATVKTTVK